MKTKYYTTKYFQKSRSFLFPLVSGEKFPRGTIETYLMCDELDEDITEYNLIVKLDKSQIVTDPEFLQNIINIYERENFNIYILDLSNWKDDVEAFLRGTYSEYSEKGKKKVLKHYNGLTGNSYIKKKDIHGSHEFYAFFFPHNYKLEVAKELYEVHKLFTSEAEAVKIILKMKELCPIYNLEKETLNLCQDQKINSCKNEKPTE